MMSVKIATSSERIASPFPPPRLVASLSLPVCRLLNKTLGVSFSTWYDSHYERRENQEKPCEEYDEHRHVD
jgi:hypothetical protein